MMSEKYTLLSELYAVLQLVSNNNITLCGDTKMMITSTNPDIKYSCTNRITSKGFTLLHKLVLIAKYCPKMRNVIEEYILLYPEEVNKVNKKGWSALLLAAYRGMLEIVKLLMKHNANINVKTNNRSTALMYASVNPTESSQKIVKLLLMSCVEHDANVNAKNSYRFTALMFASNNASESSPKIIKTLLEYDAMPINRGLCVVKDIEVLNAKN